MEEPGCWFPVLVQSCPASSSSASPDAAAGNRQESLLETGGPGSWPGAGLALQGPSGGKGMRKASAQGQGGCHARRWLAQTPQAGPSKLTRGEEEASSHQASNDSDHAVLGLTASETASPSLAPLSSSSDRLLRANPGPAWHRAHTSLPAATPVVCETRDRSRAGSTSTLHLPRPEWDSEETGPQVAF